ncbi:phage major tail tube protein [Spartinivicinus ruber]|uniref:phage major tail tube protein n=1 Tax=Spartinivicinus ruber TaxID=2683272 RepID=UPI0013D60FA5|nr:phage major tail tube protein [Spartinivicinus ruber]
MHANHVAYATLFIDGASQAGRVQSITLPKLTVKTEEFRGGGMDGVTHLDMGMEAMELSFTIDDCNTDVLKHFGFQKGKQVPFNIKGVLRNPGQGEQGIDAVCRGLVSELDFGEWKQAELSSLTATLKLDYYKLTINNQLIYEIDVVNHVRNVEGTDHMQNIRELLGL